MIDDLKYIRDLKALARADVEGADLPRLEAELYGSNDRARVVMLAAIVEIILERFLRQKTRPKLNSDDTRLLFDLRGPLGDFASKILISYAFNFYGPEMRNDLDLIRILRNSFAHSRRTIDFSTPQVITVCGHLKSPDWPGAFIPHGYLEAVKHDELKDAGDKTHPRTRYVSACHVVSERLLANSGATLGSLSYVPDMP